MQKENWYYKYHFKKHDVTNVQSFFDRLSFKNTPNSGESDGEIYGAFEYRYDQSVFHEQLRLIRRKGNVREVVLDFVDGESIIDMKVSPNEKFIAVSISNEDENILKCVVVKPLKRKSLILQQPPHISSYEWLNNDTLLLVKNDLASNRDIELLQLSISSGKMTSLFKENDKRFSLNLSKSESGELVFLHSNSKDVSEIMIVRENELECLWSRSLQKYAHVDHINDTYYVYTIDNKDQEFCVQKKGINESSWQTFIRRSNTNSFLTNMVLDKWRGVITIEQENLIPKIKLNDFDANKQVEFEPMKTPGVLEILKQQNTDDGSILLSTTSPIRPLTHHNIEKNGQLLKDLKTDRAFEWDEDRFRYENIEIETEDGEKVPVSIFHKKDILLRDSPMLCHVYGAYGHQVEMSFNKSRGYLLENDWILMFPHVRGGGGLGRKWYNDGKLQKKKSTFMDLRASLRSLHNQNISNPSKTALYGKSAGALPIGWLLNQNAERYCKAVILQSPFVSILHAMLLENQQLTTFEYLEWGNPRENTTDYDYMKSYCPYFNMSVSKNDPAILVRTSLHDNHVPSWIPLQWVAKRRQLIQNGGYSANENPLFCQVDKKGGHYTQNDFHDVDNISFLERLSFEHH
ncbi:prolyl endopeptidase-like [Clytia hemisphaerica]